MIYLKGKKWITKQHTHTGPISHYRCVSMFDNTHTHEEKQPWRERLTCLFSGQQDNRRFEIFLPQVFQNLSCKWFSNQKKVLHYFLKVQYAPTTNRNEKFSPAPLATSTRAEGLQTSRGSGSKLHRQLTSRPGMQTCTYSWASLQEKESGSEPSSLYPGGGERFGRLYLENKTPRDTWNLGGGRVPGGRAQEPKDPNTGSQGWGTSIRSDVWFVRGENKVPSC